MGPTAAFLYLIRTVAYNYSAWADLHQNLKKDRWWWGMVPRLAWRLRGFSSSGGQENYTKDGSAFWGRRAGMATIGRSPVGGRYVPHQIINSEAAVHHCGAHFQMDHIRTMHGGGKYSGIHQIHEVVGSRNGKGGRVTWIII